MYILPDMIEIGLEDGKKFPTEDHKTVAQNIGLCNPEVTNAEKLTYIVNCILNVPNDRIKTVTLEELEKEFNLYL